MFEENYDDVSLINLIEIYEDNSDEEDKEENGKIDAKNVETYANFW